MVISAILFKSWRFLVWYSGRATAPRDLIKPYSEGKIAFLQSVVASIIATLSLQRPHRDGALDDAAWRRGDGVNVVNDELCMCIELALIELPMDAGYLRGHLESFVYYTDCYYEVERDYRGFYLRMGVKNYFHQSKTIHLTENMLYAYINSASGEIGFLIHKKCK